MKHKIILLMMFVFLINLTSAIPTCSDSNEIDISGVPCVGFTIPISCSGNVTAFNTTDNTINFTIQTANFTGNIHNFTINLSRGSYELLDCQNNSATIIIGLFEQGFGINLFGIIFPSILLSIISLFVSGRMFSKMGDEDEEEHEEKENNDDVDSFVPRNRLIPIVIMLFAFITMTFMVGFVSGHLTEYLPNTNVTTFYGMFYNMFIGVFFFVFLISFIVWLSGFIKMRRVMKDLDAIE